MNKSPDNSFDESKQVLLMIVENFEEVLNHSRRSLFQVLQLWDNSISPRKDSIIKCIDRIDVLMSRCLSLLMVIKQKSESSDATEGELNSMTREVLGKIDALNEIMGNFFLFAHTEFGTYELIETSLSSLESMLAIYEPAAGIWHSLKDILNNDEDEI